MKVYIGKYKDDAERKIEIRIDDWDTWNADYTLALIAAPLLVKLKDSKPGAPLVDDEDVPDEIKSTSAAPKENEWNTDANHFKRWEWVLDEMIFAMQEISSGCEGEHKFYDNSMVDENAGIEKQIKQIKVDYEKLKQYNERIANGCRLFGKYFQCLWS